VIRGIFTGCAWYALQPQYNIINQIDDRHRYAVTVVIRMKNNPVIKAWTAWTRIYGRVRRSRTDRMMIGTRGERI
jgi:hypothetical protein